MKKYIKTNDGIYETAKHIVFDTFPSYDQIKSKRKLIFMNEVNEQADVIEDLCDEYVWDNCLIKFINKEKTKFLIKQANAEYEEEYDIKEDFDEDSSPIYGAIWTDKGLIYVAKMNEKGELELI